MNSLTPEKAAELFTGKDKWSTADAEEYGIPSIRMSDGPNGLRVEKENSLGFSESYPAAAYPCACLSACAFDPSLQYELGEHLARDCQKHDISLLLGPGVNHKRSPLCGRSFEYYSEDPFLSSELASAFIRGLQDHGVGACLKHFAGNSREYGRLVSDSIMDERALHELYLRQFERTVRRSHPWALMCAYNRLNGTYCCENETLMKEARSWGFDGAFISDWGAVSDPVMSLKAGLNLEMPGGRHGTEKRLLSALADHKISEEQLSESAEHIRKLCERTSRKVPYEGKETDTEFACRLAEESAVLLKNEKELPLKKHDTIALIGAFAKTPRIQGAGSSSVNTNDRDCLYDVMKEKNVLFSYAAGYHIHTHVTDLILEEQAVLLASRASHVVVVLGLTEGDEAEGYDRTSMRLPANQLHLLDALILHSRNITVVLETGAPVELPFRNRVQAILCMYLSGCRSGLALYRLLFGLANPCGHLAETWPEKAEDVPCADTFSSDLYQSEYRESIFSGYRYYDRTETAPAYAFGHGLSYSEFAYLDLTVRRSGNAVKVMVRVRNTGSRAGKEIVQIYVGMPDSLIERPVRELKGFAPVFLQPGETKEVHVTIEDKEFAYYDVSLHEWKTERGKYRIHAGRASDDLRLYADIVINGTDRPFSAIPAGYVSKEKPASALAREDFEKVLGHAVTDHSNDGPFTADSTIMELEKTFAGRQALKIIRSVLKRREFPGVRDSMVFEAPIRNMVWIGSTWDTVDAVVNYLNKKGSLRTVIHTVLHKDR